MRILIVKTSSLGDIIHAFPTLLFLKELFPHAEIDWVVEKPYKELVEKEPHIAKVIPIDTKKWRKFFYKSSVLKEFFSFRRELRKHEYDHVFDLQGNSKSALITYLAKSKCKIGFGWKTVWEKPNLLTTHYRYDPPLHHNVRYESLFLVESFFKEKAHVGAEKIQLKISSEECKKVEAILKMLPTKKKVMVCHGSMWQNKQMTEEALLRFLKLVEGYLECGFFFAWGSKEEKEIAERLSHSVAKGVVIDRLPLPSLQHLMEQVNLVIAMDSLPLHLAGTTATPTFSIFGASSAEKYKPYGEQHHAYQGSCPYGKTFERRCPILRKCSTGSCIRSLTGDEVFDAFKKKIKSW